MFFNGQSKKLKDFASFLRKKEIYNRDLLNDKQLQHISSIRKEALELSRKPGLGKAQAEKFIEQEGKRVEKILPKEAFLEGWAENIEVFFVAIVIALGVRSYILQPFSIPTDSMKPTLWGIYGEEVETTPSIPQRILEFAIHGSNYHEIHIVQDGKVKTDPFGRVAFRKIQVLPSLPLYRHAFTIGSQEYTVWSPNLPSKLNPGRTYKAGETVRIRIDTGDHLFVNKMVYHFFKPQRGDVFVFTTHGIEAIERDNAFSQYYIKRCVGVPADHLEIRPPHLLVNGGILDSKPAFERIYSMQDGYQGYVYPRGYAQYLTGPGMKYQVPTDHYWAMGDNSANSFDSRGWGPVVRNNLVGTGLWVYWPFTKRWGPVN
jgi:signal peptidase I